MVFRRMTQRNTAPPGKYVSQSAVLRSDNEPIARWSIHLMRYRHTYGIVNGRGEQRGFKLHARRGRWDLALGR